VGNRRLTDEDIAVFAETGVTVNHNPIGNAMLGFGTTAGRSVPRLLAAGVPIVLGSDYAPKRCPPRSTPCGRH
jgi:cytosine/adenosine deaminase-related metal-dependent hydrolase